MSDNKPADEKSAKAKPARKKLLKVKKLKNTNDMTGRVGGALNAGTAGCATDTGCVPYSQAPGCPGRMPPTQACQAR